MRARIIRCVDPKSTDKASTCLVCGERARKNKSLFEVELPCKYNAEVKICRGCSGEESGNMRVGATLDLPYVDPHYHVLKDNGRTFWEYRDVLNWIKEFMQAPAAFEKSPGIHTIHVPEKNVEFFRCEGKPSDTPGS